MSGPPEDQAPGDEPPEDCVIEDETAAPEDAAEPDVVPRPRKRGQSMAQSIGGVLFGFEQQVWRNVPPPHELVHHARPDDPLPAGDGGFMTILLPADDAEVVPSGGEPTPGSAPRSAPQPALEAGVDEQR